MNDKTQATMTIGELAARWGVSEKTVRKWIRPFREELGKIHGRIFTPQQVKIILGHLE